MKVTMELDNASLDNIIMIDQYKIKNAGQLQYLGTILRLTKKCQVEIKKRMKMGNKCFYTLSNLLSSSAEVLKHFLGHGFF